MVSFQLSHWELPLRPLEFPRVAISQEECSPPPPTIRGQALSHQWLHVIQTSYTCVKLVRQRAPRSAAPNALRLDFVVSA